MTVTNPLEKHEAADQKPALDHSPQLNLVALHKDVKPGSVASTAATHLPHLTLFSPAVDNFFHKAESAVTHTAAGLGHIAKDLGRGVVNEVKNHPGDLAKNAAIGLAVGAATLLAPEVVIGAGLAVAAEQVIAHGRGEAVDIHHPLTALKTIGRQLIDPVGDAKAIVKTAKDVSSAAVHLAGSVVVDFSPEHYNSQQVSEAHHDIQGIGSAGAEMVAGTAGFMGGSLATG